MVCNYKSIILQQYELAMHCLWFLCPIPVEYLTNIFIGVVARFILIAFARLLIITYLPISRSFMASDKRLAATSCLSLGLRVWPCFNSWETTKNPILKHTSTLWYDISKASWFIVSNTDSGFVSRTFLNTPTLTLHWYATHKEGTKLFHRKFQLAVYSAI